ncbi:MAG: SCO family protein [Maritimibacter sp.]
MPLRPTDLSRRHLLTLTGAGLLTGLAGCKRAEWHQGSDVTGASPALKFSSTRASDGRAVSQADYLGKTTLLYFGYTFCPDVCPLTLANIAQVLRNLGDEADQVRVLFVTVDPDRDTLPILAQYAELFAPQVDALRGTADEIAALARRYRVVYSVYPAEDDTEYEVSHSSAVYAFDPSGAARVLYSKLSDPTADIAGITEDLRAIMKGS